MKHFPGAAGSNPTRQRPVRCSLPRRGQRAATLFSASCEGATMAETPTIAGSYTFDPFARHQFYQDINAALVRKALGRLDADRPSGVSVRVAELASGTGAVTELVLDELERLGRPARV